MRVFLTRIATLSLCVAAFFACSKGASNNNPGDDGGTFGDDDDDDSVSPPDGKGKDGSADGNVVPPPEEVHVTLTNETMDFDGKTRSYILGMPKTYDANKSYPLVLNFHGNPSTAAAEAAYLPFDSVSKEDAIIAYPQATDGSDWDLYTETDSNLDMKWIHGLPQEIATKANVDTSRVFGFGYSGGAFFLAQFTCRFGDVFKAVSINAGGGPDEPNMGYATYDNGCYQCPGGPVAVLVTHGDSDPQVEPASGKFTKSCFATFNGCGDSLTDTTPSPCQLVDGCPADKQVKWCLIPGLGHAAWDKAMAEAWTFFKAQP